ncbi:hypothetical protein G6038_13000 [Rhodococcus sp. 14C212]|uniref:hypothetical protein n=1 Tax=Rhodococcus sp. 14C212 TaxID=2711209 RepID=UPI0013EA2550|nr:hypothetical protein [Rhodococcus sp. 14C212]NGP06383.1 hypothetical protein [Rhodococcus sp. 14C212]
MTVRLRVRDIDAVQHLRVPYMIDAGTSGLLMIHSGWLMFDLSAEDSGQHVDILSFVPYADGTIQTFARQDVAVPMVSASMTSLHVRDTGAILAVDSAVVGLEQRQFTGIQGSPFVLVMRAKAYVREGGVGRMAYQVTWQLQRDRNGRAAGLGQPFHPGNARP